MSIETNPRRTLTVEAVDRLIDEHFPGVHATGRWIRIESVADRTARCRLQPSPQSIRPGGTISGPAMFALADLTIYVALIGTLGVPAIAAVTSNLNINFLLRPALADIVADARIIRLGRRSAYAEVQLYSEGNPEMIAHATGSYAIPAK